MKITQEQYEHVKNSFPTQRGNVRLSNLQILNAFLYVAEERCGWRSLPEQFGPWGTVYLRVYRWAQSGVLDRIINDLLGSNHPAQIQLGAITPRRSCADRSPQADELHYDPPA